MPSPLFLLSELARVPLLPQWREGAPSKAACPSSAVPHDSRDPSRVARAYRAPIPPKSSGAGGRGRTRALGCSFFPSLPRLPSTFHPRSLPLILCRRREHSGGGRGGSHCGEERRRPPSSPPPIYNTTYVQLLLPRLPSPLPRSSLLLFRTPCPFSFSPGLASPARGPLVVTRFACTHCLATTNEGRDRSLCLI